MKKTFCKFIYIAGLGSFLFSACTDTRISGLPPSRETLRSSRWLSTRKHVAEPIVTVFLAASNNDSTLQPSGALKVAMTRTDELGKCAFDSLSPGIYSLKATDSDSSRSVLKADISISVIHPPQPEFSDTLVLAVPGSIQGVVTRGGVPGTFQPESG